MCFVAGCGDWNSYADAGLTSRQDTTEKDHADSVAPELPVRGTKLAQVRSRIPQQLSCVCCLVNLIVWHLNSPLDPRMREKWPPLSSSMLGDPFPALPSRKGSLFRMLLWLQHETCSPWGEPKDTHTTMHTCTRM